MRKFLALGLTLLTSYPSIACEHEHKEKIEKEVPKKTYNFSSAAIKKFILKNRNQLIGSTLISYGTYRFLKNNRFAMLGATATGFVSFGIRYCINQSRLNSQLHKAIHDNEYKQTEKLIECGADVNSLCKTERGTDSHLLFLASLRDYNFIQLLLKNGANEKLIDKDEQDIYKKQKQDCLNLALIDAIQGNDNLVVKEYIERGASLTGFMVDRRPYWPIFRAKASTPEIMKLILDKLDPKQLSGQDEEGYHELCIIYENKMKQTVSTEEETPEREHIQHEQSEETVV